MSRGEGQSTSHLYDEVTLSALLQFAPSTLAEEVHATMRKASSEFLDDKMFACVRSLDAIVDQISSHGAAMQKGLPLTFDTLFSSTSPSKHSRDTAAVALPLKSSLRGGRAAAAAAVAATTTTTVKDVAVVPALRRPAATPLSLRLIASFIRKTHLFKVSHKKADECHMIISDCEIDDGWTVQKKQENGDGYFVREEPGKPNMSFKCRNTLPMPLLAVASIIIELDLFRLWVPLCHVSRELGSPTPFHKVAQFAISLPWPFANRDVVLEGYGMDDLTSKRLVVNSRSVREGVPMVIGGLPPAPPRGTIRSDLQYGGFLLEVVDRKTTRVTFILNVDPKMPTIPTGLINWICGKLIGVILYFLCKAASGEDFSIKRQYLKRQEEKKVLYEYLRKRLDEALDDDNPSSSAAALNSGPPSASKRRREAAVNA